MTRAFVLALLCAASLLAQAPRSIYPWWTRPAIARDLNLSAGQREQIRSVVRQYRPHLMNVRTAVNQAEQFLAEEFYRDPVDPEKNQRSYRTAGRCA